jgi:hypothetical protein
VEHPLLHASSDPTGSTARTAACASLRPTRSSGRRGFDGAKTLISAESAMGKPENYPTAAPACMYGSAHNAIIGKEASVDGSNAVCSVPN